MNNTTSLLTSINVQSMVIFEGKLNTWVDFDVDIRPLGRGRYTTANANDAISDILMDIAEELSSEKLVEPCCFEYIGGAYIINLTNGGKIIVGKFWPDEIPGIDISKTRMWRQETEIDVYQFESLMVKCALKKRPL